MNLTKFLKKKSYTTIDLKVLPTGHFFIKAKINGIKGKFIVDTGASNSVIDFKDEKKFKLKAKASKIKAAGAGNSEMKTKIGSKSSLKIGKWKIKNLSIVLFDLSHVNIALTTNQIKPVDGILGADVLNKAKAIIDYKSKKMYFK